jgi:hypothetical protein
LRFFVPISNKEKNLTPADVFEDSWRGCGKSHLNKNMKNSKRIQLDRTKLLAFRKMESVPTGLGKESTKRSYMAMVGGKIGAKVGSKPT